MKIMVSPGKYIVAVSGGVDSMVLLDLLTKMDGLELVVAHFDHGIREDSHLDAAFVEAASKGLGLPCETGRADLGYGASEESARIVRYDFLRGCQAKHLAQGIITAHHRDDLLETAIINISRGTGRHGLSSLRSRSDLLRPMLGWSKQDVLDYASSSKIDWREDLTNEDTVYLRNHVRKEVLPKLSAEQRESLTNTCMRAAELNSQIDQELGLLLKYKSYRHGGLVYRRAWFNALPHDLCMDIVHHWMRQLDVHDYSRPKIDKIVLQLKTLRPGKQIQVGGGTSIAITKRSLRLSAS